MEITIKDPDEISYVVDKFLDLTLEELTVSCGVNPNEGEPPLAGMIRYMLCEDEPPEHWGKITIGGLLKMIAKVKVSSYCDETEVLGPDLDAFYMSVSYLMDTLKQTYPANRKVRLFLHLDMGCLSDLLKGQKPGAGKYGKSIKTAIEEMARPLGIKYQIWMDYELYKSCVVTAVGDIYRTVLEPLLKSRIFRNHFKTR